MRSCYAHYMTTTQERKFQILYNEARIAGLEAGKLQRVIPMVVSQHVNLLDDRTPITESYFVESGVCGFAWINIRPANCGFANWCRKKGLGKTSGYQGGLNLFVHDFGQSLQRKEAFAHAFAEVLSKAGITAYGNSRID